MSLWTDRELKILIARVDALEKLFNQFVDNVHLTSSPNIHPVQIKIDKRTKEWKNANS